MKTFKEFNDYLNDNFKKWFGNSIVVDKRGKPLVVYHGTPDSRYLKSTGIFKTSGEKFIDHIDDDAKKEVKDKRAYFFTDNFNKANSYADDHRAFDYQNAEPKVLSVYLKIENPFILNAGGEIWRKFKTEINGIKLKGTRNIVEYAQNNGYDGLIVKNVRDNYNNTPSTKPGTVYTVFSPYQIKSATHNNGNFDSNNKNINENFNKITIGDFLKASETNKPNWTEFDINSIKSEFGFIEKLWSELYKEYENKPQSILQFVLGQINNLKRKNINGIDTVEIFRAITLPLGDIKKGLGKYWTSDEEFAIVYHSYNYDEKDVYVLRGYCSLNDIDWHFTLGADYKSGDIPMPIEEWGTSWGEVEVRLIEGSTVYVDGYKNNNKWISINRFYYIV